MTRSTKDFKQHLGKIKDSVQSGLTSLQQVAQLQCSSHFYPSTLGLQHSIKCGWLKKTSGVLKTWQKRWFDIKGDRLYYYLDSHYVKPPQGGISLPGNHVVEHIFKTNDSERFVFEIVPDRDILPNSEAITLAAESEEERTDWIRVIKQILYGSVGGAIFGKPLEETLRFEKSRNSKREIPEIVEACVEYILEHGLREEGIFRLTGKSALIKSYSDAYDRGERPCLNQDKEMDVHSVSSLLKLYLRELPSPLVPFDCYEDAIRSVTRGIPDDINSAMESLHDILAKMATPNYNLLQYLCKFLNLVGREHTINKMTFANIAKIFSTAFIRPDVEKDPCLLMATSSSRIALTRVLIEHQAWLFSDRATPFEGVINVEDLLGIETRDVSQNISPRDVVDATFHCKSLPECSRDSCINDEGSSMVVMRRDTIVEREVEMRHGNRRWLAALKNPQSLEDIYCRWNSRHMVHSDVLNASNDGDGRFAREENNSPTCSRIQSCMSAISQTAIKHPSTEYADACESNGLSGITSFLDRPDSREANNESGILPFEFEGGVDNFESLTSYLDNSDADNMSKSALKSIIDVLLERVQKQQKIILELSSKLNLNQ